MTDSIGEFDRTAVITIQGGGIYGLSMLGQLQALLAKFEIVPLAIAGTSAGAIVAALYWAGLSPMDICNKFVGLTTGEDDRHDSEALMNLLGKFEPAGNEFTFSSFTKMQRSCTDLVSGLEGGLESDEAKGCLVAAASPIRAFCQWMQTWWRTFRIIPSLRSHWKTMGIFRGDVLEQTIDTWIRSSKRLSSCRESLPADGLLTFNDIRKTADYFPPLFLVATNLTQRRLELFSSLEERYGDVPIARAVRASAGFPGFFRPTKIQGEYYVDGGVISNFPAWVFSDALRRKLAKYPEHYGLASRPWVHFGLRVVPDPVVSREPETEMLPKEFVRAMASLGLGMARNELEDILAGFLARSHLVEQSVKATSGPQNILQFDEVNRDTIASMFVRGRECAEKSLEGLSFRLPPRQMVQSILERLVRESLIVLGRMDNDSIKFRSNVFLPQRDELVLFYSVYMDEDPDRAMRLHFETGLTGFCYTRRCIQICNLHKIAELAEAGQLDTYKLFGMHPEQHALVRKDRTWLLSVPIFDPCAKYVGSSTPERGGFWSRNVGQHYFGIESEGATDGAVLGVLNIDAAIPYDEIGMSDDPARHWTDVRIQAIISLAQNHAIRLARLLSDAFGTREV
jgi:predicted acylesterase/phospholipase RssA